MFERDAITAVQLPADHPPDEETCSANDAPPAWAAFGLGLLVVAAMTIAALWIAELFEVLGFAAQ
jgi:hypothetical protein